MYYVAYGSNMNLEQMEYRCPNSKVVGTGVIKDWKLVFNTHADIIPCDGEYVPVVVWDISEDDWGYLDKYEGYPTYYKRDVVDVEMDNGENETCQVYVMNDDRKGFYPPFEYYFSTIVEGYYDNNIDDTSALYRALEESWENNEGEMKEAK